MDITSRLQSLHFNHGNKVKYRIRVTAGLVTAALLTHAAEAFGLPIGTAAIYVNLAVSFVWVWE